MGGIFMDASRHALFVASAALMGLALAVAPGIAEEATIPGIQGADHATLLPSGVPVTTSGVVTGVFGKGFFLQALIPDGNARTSDGLYVFLPNPDTFPAIEAGQVLKVTGRPVEFKPFPELPIQRTRKVVTCGTTDVTEVPSNDRDKFLPITELTDVSAIEVLGTAELPPPVDLLPPGARIPIASADAPNTPFDPNHHPRDYFETLEGMRVRIPDAVAVSRKEDGWDAFWVATAGNLATDEVSASGLPLEREDHVFPEVIQVHKADGQPRLALVPGTKLGDLTGVLTYENGNYMVVLDQKIDPAHLQAPTPAPQLPLSPGVRIASYNTKNLSAVDPVARFQAIAKQIVTELGAPDIIALQEIQDDDGKAITSVVTAGKTLGLLVNAISAAGGPTYKVIALDPILPNTDGGEPGGNIRTAFLLKEGTPVTPGMTERLFDGADRCTDQNAFKFTRKPLLLEAAIAGQPYVLVNLHLSSKLGDDGLYLAVEDPQQPSTADRWRQVEALLAELERRYRPTGARIILMGDFNDVAGSESLKPLFDSAFRFTSAPDSRGPKFKFSHAHNGVRTAIDHFMISAGVPADVVKQVIYLDVNVDAADQVSDHNPIVLVLD